MQTGGDNQFALFNVLQREGGHTCLTLIDEATYKLFFHSISGKILIAMK